MFIYNFIFFRDNIAAFGGDADQVTIMGESAGSASVTYHMLSPLSQRKCSNHIRVYIFMEHLLKNGGEGHLLKNGGGLHLLKNGEGGGHLLKNGARSVQFQDVNKSTFVVFVK